VRRIKNNNGKNVTSIKTINSLKEAFNIHPKDVISIVGAGGKTTLMFALSRELGLHKKVVITTTTTKIFPPSKHDSPYLLISQEDREIVNFILKKAGELNHITIACKVLTDSGKLQGIDPLLISKLLTLSPVNYIIVEADGASQKPLKAPNPLFEPVIPQQTSLVIPVVGIDSLGCVLSEENVFRSEIVAKLTGLSLGTPISAESIATLILHPAGLTRGSPEQARIIPAINKTDLPANLSGARDVADKILKAHHPKVDRVVLTQAQLHPPVTGVVFKGK
jgi:probable selenium-dependent hydroxylase accessory protein YqeC